MRNLLAGIGAVLLGTSFVSYAQSPALIPLTDNETPALWFVELASPPVIDGSSSASLEHEEAAFHAAAADAGVRYSETRHFRDLFNGLTVRAGAADANKLRALEGVQAVYPVASITIAQQDVQPDSELDLITAIKQTGADIAQSELGLSGRGVNVAVIDTGIDFDHPDLGGCFGPGCRVAKGFDFVGDAFDNDTVTTVTPDPFPDDCNGHGTHVAGIIGANGDIKGVAPGVTFFAYRVFGCEGTTTADIMLDAMERARRDGADVVNISIGSAFQWPEYPTARAADRLVRHGIVVVASAGNDGAAGLYASSAPSVGERVIAVASFENTAANLDAFSISSDDKKIGYMTATGAPAPPRTGSFPMARTGTATSPADACAPLRAGSLADKIALIRRGTCSFNQKAFNAQSAGAVGVVVYNNVAGFVSPTVTGPPDITIPVVAITSDRGALIDGRLAAGAVTMTWTDTFAGEPNPTANLISSFSSYGLAPDLSFKPDIGAPGGLIRSTLPLEQGGHGVLSGTSMASPHVAGAVALLLEAHPHATPAEVEARLQNSARPHLFSGNAAAGFLDNVHRQGAGMLQINDAIEATTVVSPGNLALGEIESGSVTRWLTIASSGRRHEDRSDHARSDDGDRDGDDGDENDDEHETVTYKLGHQPALSTGANTFIPQFLASFATVEFSTPTVSLRGDDEAIVRITITPPPASGVRLFGGYVTLTQSDDPTKVLRVPYAGYNGDYQAIQIFTLAGFPLLAKRTAAGFLPLPNGALFTMQGDDMPFVLLHLNQQVANLKMEVIDVATGRSLNFADDEDFLPRNSAANTFFAIAWDGTTMRRPGGRLRTVPNGTYRIDLSVLKALGDPRNPAHVERWSSPNITIARPSS